MQSIYVQVSYRTWDQYYARFEGYCIGTDLRWWEGLDYEKEPAAVEAAIKGLSHGETAYLRLRTRIPYNDCDELVVFRFDVPAGPNTETIYVQYTRWKYRDPKLVILANQQEPHPLPYGITLHDCAYDVTLTVPATSSSA